MNQRIIYPTPDVPSAAEVLAAVPIYEAELEASKKAAFLSSAN